MVFSVVAPSGVVVTSSVPIREPQWMERGGVRTVVWSYTCWLTRIAEEFGHAAPRRWFDSSRVMNPA